MSIKNKVIRRQQLNFLAFLSLVIFIAIGTLINHHFLNKSLFIVFFKGNPVWQQVLIGIVFGLAASFFAWRIIQSSILENVRKFFIKFLKPFQFRFVDIVFISFCAGIGEELLFRASIQPILGIWVTAIIFVMLHGYLSLKNWQLSIYGIYMVIVAAGFGYLFEWVGIISAIISHAVIDITLLWIIRELPYPEAETGEDAENDDVTDLEDS